MQQEVVRIYATQETARLAYALRIIFDTILGIEYELITDKRKLGKSPVVNYSRENIPGAFNISPHQLLFENDIREQEIWVGWWNDMPVLFPSSPESDFPMDIFASSFYLITRYEEYLSFAPDMHGRYFAELSIAWRNNFLQMPVIDLWARAFATALVKRFPRITVRRNKYSALMTIDVDQAFAFRGRSMAGSLTIFLKDHPGLESSKKEKIECLMGRKADPYDTFSYIEEQFSANKVKNYFFFPVGRRGEFDKNPSPNNRYYRKLIRKRICHHNVGIHPSYASFASADLIGGEKRVLEGILKRQVVASRQHYIRMKFPDTYRVLINNGITTDYSMGFVSENGFRAGIARPFPWFDLEADTPTELTVVPFQIMDGTLNIQKFYDVEKAREEIGKLIDATRKVGGYFVSVWHNTSLIERGPWKGWKELFEYTLKEQNRDD